MDDVDVDNIKLYDIDEDMDRADQDVQAVIRRNKPQWKPFFEPRTFLEESDKPTLDQCVLSKRQLKNYGKKVSQIRELFR